MKRQFDSKIGYRDDSPRVPKQLIQANQVFMIIIPIAIKATTIINYYHYHLPKDNPSIHAK